MQNLKRKNGNLITVLAVWDLIHCCAFRPANACLHIYFLSCVWKAHVRLTYKNSGATSFWASTSVWESLLNAKKLHFCSFSYVSLLYAWWIKYVFDYFKAFFIVFDHENTCASMRYLVEIHNNKWQGCFNLCFVSRYVCFSHFLQMKMLTGVVDILDFLNLL